MVYRTTRREGALQAVVRTLSGQVQLRNGHMRPARVLQPPAVSGGGAWKLETAVDMWYSVLLGCFHRSSISLGVKNLRRLLSSGVPTPAPSSEPKPKAAPRRPEYPSMCVYCGAYAVTVVVVNGGAIPVCARHMGDPEGEGIDPDAPEGGTLPPIPDLPVTGPVERGPGGPPVLPPADGLFLPDMGPPEPGDAPRIHRAIRRRPRGGAPAAPPRR